MTILWIALGAALVLFVLVLTVRTMLFRPRPIPTVDATPIEFDRDAATEALRALVTCRTVSRYERADEEDGEFEKLVALLPTLYPRAHATLTLRRFDGRALLFYWKGREAGPATVLMAHYDVVPVDEAKWDKPPFAAMIEDGHMWGRGTLDTKGTFNGIFSAANRGAPHSRSVPVISTQASSMEYCSTCGLNWRSISTKCREASTYK